MLNRANRAKQNTNATDCAQTVALRKKGLVVDCFEMSHLKVNLFYEEKR